MSATDRQTNEQLFHDRQALLRAAWFAHHSLRFADSVYLDHETWIRPAFARLGDVRGKCVLDFGCGHGMAAVVLSRAGARVTAFDLSLGYLTEARRRADANDAMVNFVQADGERLPFANATFDRIWGNAVLHHLDMTIAANELHRVLRPGGIAVFCEPWGENPFLRWARGQLPYAGKERTRDEQPLRSEHVRQLRQVFPNLEIQGYQLLSMARRVLRPGRVISLFDRADAALLTQLPILQRFCRYVVLILQRAEL
ncbi:MAG: class I SAM-dependent methyltransferase [Gemmataceae bacterium]|nr:class I SAM-dependent methyltransferase [Gemmataceae bacterium]